MLTAFREERSAAAARGSWAAARYTCAALMDVVLAGLRERRHNTTGHATRPSSWLRGAGHDVRHAVRSLARSWTFTTVCLFSLAIGFALNAALFVMLQLTLDPPAAIDPDGAVELLVTTRGALLDDIWSYPDFRDVARAETGVEVTGWTVGQRHLRTRDGADGSAVSTMYVSANYFETLGIRLPRGRAFLPEEDDVVGDPPVVIGHDLWQGTLGGDPGVLGSELNLNGTAYRIVGIAPQHYRGQHAGYSADVWVPLWTHPMLGPGGELREDRGAAALQLLGRLQEGATLQEAAGAVAGVMRGLADAHPVTNQDRGATVVAYAKQGGGDADGGILRAMMLGLSGMVLLVVCMNVGGMVLVRSAMRQRELALRLALGSSRLRLVRYLMTESAVIAGLGAVLSTVAGMAALRVIGWRIGQPVPPDLYASVIMVSAVLSVVALFVIGLAPALQFTRPELLRTVKDDSGAGGRRSSRTHRVATSVQTAVALPLLVLPLMSIQAARLTDEGDYGFAPENLYVARFDLAVDGYDPLEAERFLHEVRSSVASMPEVRSASIADAVPLDYRRRNTLISRSGEEAFVWVQTTRAGEDYFHTIGTPIVRGRAFGSGDVPESESVAVVTASLAELLWPGLDPIGQRVSFSSGAADDGGVTVVGVAADVVGWSHDSDATGFFVPLAQHPTRQAALVIRTSREDPILATAIQERILQVGPDVTRPPVQTSRDLMEGPKREIYAMSWFIVVLSMLTLMLAALGVYGVVAFAVTNRTREIGVRMAVGATRRGVVRMVLGDGLRLALPGIAVGLLIAVVLGQQVLAGWYQYLNRETMDPVLLTAAAAASVSVVLLASVIPARRAARVSPMVALRAD